MDDFFGALGKRITNTVDELGKKAGDTLDIQKLKNQINTLQRANDRDFVDMGKKIYARFQNAEMEEPDFTAVCEEIKKRDGQIETLEQAIDRIKGV